MKHPHADLIKQWIEDTTQDIEILTSNQNWQLTTIDNVIINNGAITYQFRIKPKPDEYEHLKQAIKEGKQIAELQLNGEWKSIDKKYNSVIPDFFDGRLSASNFKVVDEYEHLHHALRDGKKIEVFFMNKWQLLKNGDSLDTLIDANKYRIYDQYRELKEAQEQGKRIVWQNSLGEWEDLTEDDFKQLDIYGIDRYKIVEFDIIETVIINQHYDVFGGVKIKLTKSGIDGTIKAEVV